jgi:hypothetical protein
VGPFIQMVVPRVVGPVIKTGWVPRMWVQFLYTESLSLKFVGLIIQTGCVLGMCSSSTDRLCLGDVDLVIEMVVSRC